MYISHGITRGENSYQTLSMIMKSGYIIPSKGCATRQSKLNVVYTRVHKTEISINTLYEDMFNIYDYVLVFDKSKINQDSIVNVITYTDEQVVNQLLKNVSLNNVTTLGFVNQLNLDGLYKIITIYDTDVGPKEIDNVFLEKYGLTHVKLEKVLTRSYQEYLNMSPGEKISKELYTNIISQSISIFDNYYKDTYTEIKCIDDIENFKTQLQNVFELIESYRTKTVKYLESYISDIQDSYVYNNNFDYDNDKEQIIRLIKRSFISKDEMEYKISILKDTKLLEYITEIKNKLVSNKINSKCNYCGINFAKWKCSGCYNHYYCNHECRYNSWILSHHNTCNPIIRFT